MNFRNEIDSLLERIYSITFEAGIEGLKPVTDYLDFPIEACLSFLQSNSPCKFTRFLDNDDNINEYFQSLTDDFSFSSIKEIIFTSTISYNMRTNSLRFTMSFNDKDLLWKVINLLSIFNLSYDVRNDTNC